MLNGLDLFSGIGGLSLALSPWVRPIAYCENDRYAQAVLLQRMQYDEIAPAPIWDDITTFLPELLPRQTIDIIYGGFPCQDISVAGTGTGLEGKRSGLFYEIIRLCSMLRPRFVFLENVPAITVRGLDRILLEFTSLGYDCRWTIVSAAELSAPHLRERWFMLAHANGIDGRNERKDLERRNAVLDKRKAIIEYDGYARNAVDTDSKRLERWEKSETAWQTFAQYWHSNGTEWPQGIPKPTICRNDDGIRNRVDRLRGLGNAVVPLQAQEAFKRLMGIN